MLSCAPTSTTQIKIHSESNKLPISLHYHQMFFKIITIKRPILFTFLELVQETELLLFSVPTDISKLAGTRKHHKTPLQFTHWSWNSSTDFKGVWIRPKVSILTCEHRLPSHSTGWNLCYLYAIAEAVQEAYRTSGLQKHVLFFHCYFAEHFVKCHQFLCWSRLIYRFLIWTTEYRYHRLTLLLTSYMHKYSIHASL